jgi:hypothetical protein
MKNNMEQPIDNTETMPTFLQDFVQELKVREGKTRSKSREIHRDPGMKNIFISNGAERIVREGNFSDYVKLDQTHRALIADHLIEESYKGRKDKENYQQEKIVAKLMAFYKKEQEIITLYAEARDDEKLTDLALAMEKEMPFLGDLYENYMNEFSANAQVE